MATTSVLIPPPPTPTMFPTDKSQSLQSKLNLPFSSTHHITQALCAAGVVTAEGNKPLALLGDTLLRLHLQLEGLSRGASRKQIDTVLKQVALNTNLTRRCRELGIEAYIANNPSQGSYIPDTLMATTMEAIIGAYFVDQGRDLAAVGVVVGCLGLGWPGDIL
ncbi:hypothetical protein BJX61DRAFT_546490 [Aspergillus egyptiacus]|nr:hypothetical protein BJX61DRAFT_546490 [Aspergillus egyptiacus]